MQTAIGGTMENRNGIARKHPGARAIASGVTGVVGGKRNGETRIDGQVARGGPQSLCLQQKCLCLQQKWTPRTRPQRLGLQHQWKPRTPPQGLGLQQKWKPRAPTPMSSLSASWQTPRPLSPGHEPPPEPLGIVAAPFALDTRQPRLEPLRN